MCVARSSWRSNRDEMVRAAFGAYAAVPDGPVSQLHWIREGKRLVHFDTAGARALLARKGWRDSNGDGVLDQGGRDLTLSSTSRATVRCVSIIAPMVQEQWRRIGVKVDLLRLDGPVWAERRDKGEFDVDFLLRGARPQSHRTGTELDLRGTERQQRGPVL
jgi:peptide/nickel transport system substrate-binding protein